MVWNANLLPEYSYSGTNRSRFAVTEALLKKVPSILNRLAYEVMPPYDFDPNLTKAICALFDNVPDAPGVYTLDTEFSTNTKPKGSMFQRL